MRDADAAHERERAQADDRAGGEKADRLAEHEGYSL
jgi:hypothetical protein